MPNLPNVVKKYSLNHDKVYEILKDLQKYYTELSSESENAKYADMIYTDEEEAIVLRRCEKMLQFIHIQYFNYEKRSDIHTCVYTTTPWINLKKRA